MDYGSSPMTDQEQPPYSITDVEVVSETENLVVRLFSIGVGEEIGWHFHNNVADIFIGIDGVTVIETKAPRGRHELSKGDHLVVPPKTAHRVSGKDGQACRFALTQGVGHYDFVPVG